VIEAGNDCTWLKCCGADEEEEEQVPTKCQLRLCAGVKGRMSPRFVNFINTVNIGMRTYTFSTVLLILVFNFNIYYHVCNFFQIPIPL
jgi:hypothetical protein